MKKKIKGSVMTDRGIRREYNDDVVCAVPEVNFYAVADGIGQMAYGRTTAELACRLMSDQVRMIYQDYRRHRDEGKASEDFRNALAEISNTIFRKGNDPEVYRYGCTFCGIMILEKQIAVINIGDSRAYVKFRKETELTRITEDHNLAVSASKNGYMTYEEAVQRGLASRLLNFVGISDATEVDLFQVDRIGADAVLLCSDGLSGMVTDRDMAVCMKNHKAPDRICRNLIRMANRRGGRDNISAAVIKLNGKK